jgi:uncharacterized protein YaaN involved in tellurite resistance
MSTYKNLFETASPVGTSDNVMVTTAIEPTTPQPVAPFVTSQEHPLLQQLRQLPVERFNEIGGPQTQQLVSLSDQLLQKTKASDTGEFGRGMNSILRLMSTIQYDQLGEPAGISGLITRIKRNFKLVQTDLLQAFDSAKGQIDKINQDLRLRLTVIESDLKWLASAYAANLADLRSLEEILPLLQTLRAETTQQLQQIPAEDHLQAAPTKQRLARLEQRIEAIDLQIHQAKLRAIQIKALEAANQGIVDDFRSLLENAIPAWGTDISMGLLSLRQKANIEISNRMKDQIQTSMKRAAEQIHDNVIDAEKALQRQAVDVQTLRHVQERTIDMIRQKTQLASQHAQQREQTLQELARMDQELKSALNHKP